MKYQIKKDSEGSPYVAVRGLGMDILVDPMLNKGTAFTARERDELGLNGLLPPAVSTFKEQLQRTYAHFTSHTDNLAKHINLMSLHDRNEVLFYRLLQDHIEEMMPIVYTPVVGEACQKFSQIYRQRRGIYISIDQQDRIEDLLANFPSKDPAVIVVTDGERILGLGDQGIGGMGISIGKLTLYTLCAGIPPHTTLPIMLDVGTDNDALLQDPLYLGLRQKRVRGQAYQDFIDKFVSAVQKVFPNVLLQWEDFLKGNAIHQLSRFRDQLCTFNDDIQGTASVALAGVFSGLEVTGQSMRDQRLVFAGAGAAAQGIAGLFELALQESGLSPDEARRQIWTVDSKGLVTSDRANLDEFKRRYARDPSELMANASLLDVVENVKPTILLGASGIPGTFSEAIVRKMAEINKRPMIFPLSNPTSKAECTPQDALQWSDGRAVICTGSPFAPVTLNGKTFRIGQGNNAFIFPGVGLGIMVADIRRVTDGMFYEAARALKGVVRREDLDEGSIFPRLTRIREASHAVACAVVRRAVREGHANATVLNDLEARVSAAMWNPDYLPIRYEP